MEKGYRSLATIKRDYYELDKTIYEGDTWILFEHEEYGDERKMMAVNMTQKYYTLTWETLDYTIENLEDEYNVYSLLDD